MAAAGSHHHYVYADSEDNISSDLICAVCHDVCGTHSACPGCQQTFCEVREPGRSVHALLSVSCLCMLCWLQWPYVCTTAGCLFSYVCRRQASLYSSPYSLCKPCMQSGYPAAFKSCTFMTLSCILEGTSSFLLLLLLQCLHPRHTLPAPSCFHAPAGVCAQVV
jgi:hypothetical protein